MLNVALIGMGAIGGEVLRRLHSDVEIRVTHVIVHSSKSSVDALHAPAGFVRVQSVNEIEVMPDFALECASARAVEEHVIPLLQRGVDVAVCSVAAFIDEDLARRVRAAAISGNARLLLLAGAVGGIDAIASARLLGLDTVSLTSRKAPAAWAGTPAETVCDLRNLKEPAVLFHGCARQAARLYPKNANVAATVALAGLGLDKTVITLIADPASAFNTHEIEARGAFGEMRYITSNQSLPANPKTSALVVASALRALHNEVTAIRI
jgi:aspartate dehydrogenase